MKTIKIKDKNSIPNKFTGIAEYPSGLKSWYKKGKKHREDGPAIEFSEGTNFWYIEDKLYLPEKLSELIDSSFYLGKEKGQYSLEWLKFLTKEGIKEFPIIFGIKECKEFKNIFEKFENHNNKR